MQQKVLIAITNHAKLGDSELATGYWLAELAQFYWILFDANIDMDFVSPSGGPAALDPSSVTLCRDPFSQRLLADGEVQNRLQHTLKPEDINPQAYFAIYYPGGHGPMFDIANDEAIGQIAGQIYQHGGIIAAVCHGVAGLLAIRDEQGQPLLRGRQVTGFSNLEETLIRKRRYLPHLLEDQLKQQGACYRKRFPFIVTHVVVDGRLITGQNPKATRGVATALLSLCHE